MDKIKITTPPQNNEKGTIKKCDLRNKESKITSKEQNIKRSCRRFDLTNSHKFSVDGIIIFHSTP